MQLGALFAAGHNPNTIADLTWGQVLLMVTGVQAYHMDLAARLVSGKSPTMEAARQAGGAVQSSGTNDAATEQRTVNEIKAFAEQSRKYGSGGVGVAVATEAPGGPDGFKLVAWLRGVAPQHRREAMAAAMSGSVDLDADVPTRWADTT